MHFVSLQSSYYLDPAVATLDDAAEVLFMRSIAYCGNAESGGLIPEEVLPALVRGYTRAKARRLAQSLCDTVPRPLWIRVDGGWRLRSWEAQQSSLEALVKRRRSDRERKAAERTRQRTASRDSDCDTSRDQSQDASRDMSRDGGRDMSGGKDKRREEETAAAAADARGSGGVTPLRKAASTTDLPPTVEILRGKLDQAGLTVRWDDLDGAQLVAVEDLVAMHGDAALVAAAQRSRAAHSAPPAYAKAWLPVWLSMPDPAKRRLAAVPEPLCTEPGHETEPARSCRACASERKAGQR